MALRISSDRTDEWLLCDVLLPINTHVTIVPASTDGVKCVERNKFVIPVDSITGTQLCRRARDLSLTLLFAAGRSPVAGELSLRARTAADLAALSDGVFDAVHRSRRAAVFRAAVAEIERAHGAADRSTSDQSASL
jgi:hypothetical protein